jgi:hypothetical protein
MRDAYKWFRTSAALLAAAVLAVPGAVRLQAMSNQSAAPAFRTVEKGSQSNIDAARQVVIRTAAEWAAFWKTHNYDKPAPPIDFGKEMVIGVFMGSRPTGGYSTEISAIAERDNGLVVTYREASPRADAMTVQVLTFPYQLVATAKRAGEVTFEKKP